MKKLSVSILALIFSFGLLAQDSKLFESLTIKSTILNKEIKYAVYLPPGYESSNRSYPVLYLLHGGGGSHLDWIQKGEMQRTTDNEIAEGKAQPMIVVMPDAERSFYMNNVNGEYQYEDFFIKELMPYIEKTYRCLKEKKYRAVAGLSMGGYGSLLYALHYPQLFSSCAALSAGVRTDEEINKMPLKDYLERYKTPMGDHKEGDVRITDFWNQNSVLFLLNHIPEGQKKAVRFYLDCGDDDHLYKGNSILHITMRDLDIPHEYRVRNGGHDWEYWRTGLPAALEFISMGFK